MAPRSEKEWERMTTVQFAVDRSATRVKFWATATILAAPVELLATWAVSTAFGVMDGTPFVGVDLTPIQAFVVGCYVTGPFAAVLYCWGEWNVACGHASQSWPTAPAVVRSSRVADRNIYRRGTCYRLEVTYSYKVDGFEY